MRNIIVSLCISLTMLACKNNNGAMPVDFHEVTAKESINTNAYTYVRVSEADKEQWVAIPKTDIKIGNTYYYQGGMVMNNFESKELKRTFASVVFLEGLSDDKDKVVTKPTVPMQNQANDNKHTNVNATNVAKIDSKIKPAKGGISIGDLFAKKDHYSGEKVKITGQVTKFSPEIMKKNWIHLQDGTENDGKFDLTVTTNVLVKVGDTITLEGKIALDKDFGYGYAYEVLMEDAVITK